MTLDRNLVNHYGRSQLALDAEGKAIRTFKRSNYNLVRW